MNRSTVRSFVMRHRRSIQDLSILLAVLLVGLFIAFEIDVFENENTVTVHEQTIELDEVLLLGGILAVGLLVFAIRRNREQKRESLRRLAAEEQIRELAYQDGLTGLPNRRQFDTALATALASPPRAGASHAVLLMDLNGFKRVNDIHGHGIGDELLVVVAQRLLGAMRNGDLVARLGGDEFAILACHVASAEAATSVALRVIEALQAPITTGQATHQIGCWYWNSADPGRRGRSGRIDAQGGRRVVSRQIGTPFSTEIFRTPDGPTGARARAPGAGVADCVGPECRDHRVSTDGRPQQPRRSRI